MTKHIVSQARQERHARIQFEQGHYHQTKKQEKESSSRFLSHVGATVLFFVFSYFISFQFAGAYQQDVPVELPKQLNPEQVFVLQADGFVLKPSTQTQKADRSTSTEVIEYAVQPGDTLSGIAGKFSIRTQTLIENNPNINALGVLKVGSVIKILPVDGFFYSVEKKDTLASIAKKYNIKEEDIKKQNQLVSTTIKEGQQLILPGARKIYPQPVYVAKKGGKGGKSYAPSNPGSYAGAITGNYIWPANGGISQYFNKWHYAIDIANRNRGPIYATAGGVVVKASSGWNGGYGNVVMIDHGNGVTSLYAHNEKLYVQVGDKISQGQTIAWMGNSGRVRGATGIHLHFEIIQNGVKKNPLAYIGGK